MLIGLTPDGHSAAPPGPCPIVIIVMEDEAAFLCWRPRFWRRLGFPSLRLLAPSNCDHEIMIVDVPIADVQMPGLKSCVSLIAPVSYWPAAI